MTTDVPGPKLLLLDTASLYFRAYFGVPSSMRAPDGTPTNAVRGLLDFIARLVGTRRPQLLACCWDDDWRPAWRVELVPGYKQHRLADTDDGSEQVPAELAVQVPVIRQVLGALGLAVVGAPGCEADDVIGTLATAATGPVDVVTGDRDLFQLVDDARGVRVVYTAKGGVGRAEEIDDAAVRSRYGVPASGYADFATLRGDTSDGLPGVPGVGDKTAASLIAVYGDLDGVLAAAADPAGRLSPGVRRRILDAADYLQRARTVVQVRRDADLGAAARDLAIPPAPAQPGEWAALVERYDLGTSAQRVEAVLAGGTVSAR
jgi:5'-3' exonuclease